MVNVSRLLCVVSALFGCGAGLALAGPNDVPASGKAQEDAWKRFEVQGIRLGAELSAVSGLVCDRNPNGHYRKTCVKFVDDRCKGRPNIVKATGGHAPKGESCFFGGYTYVDLNGDTPEPPISAIIIGTTDEEVPHIAEINYYFPNSPLTADSKLGKALTAKYGRPDYVNDNVRLAWQVGKSILLAADCGQNNGHEVCVLGVEDLAYFNLRRDMQQQKEERTKKESAPEPPKL